MGVFVYAVVDTVTLISEQHGPAAFQCALWRCHYVAVQCNTAAAAVVVDVDDDDVYLGVI